MLLSHSVELFEEHPAVDGVVLVVPEGWEEPATLLADGRTVTVAWGNCCFSTMLSSRASPNTTTSIE